MTYFEKKMKEAEEKFNNLCLLDNAIMNFAFKDNKLAVQHIVRIIMEKPDLIVSNVKVQQFSGNHFGHSVTFDITAYDSEGNFYDIEMQNDATKASERRARYHAGMADKELLPKNVSYECIPDSYIIFITRGKALGYDLPIMHIDKTIRENNEPYDDGGHIIFVNANHNKGTSPLSQLMNDLTRVNPADIKGSQILIDALYSTKTNKEVKDMWVDNYFGYEEEIWDKATAVATKATRIKDIINFYNNGTSLEIIQKSTGLSSDEIANILKETKA